MRKALVIFIVITLTGIALVPQNLTADDLSSISNSHKSTVHVLAESGEVFKTGEEAVQDPETGKIYILTNLVGAQEQRKGIGIVINSVGFIATNLHVVNNARRVTITFHDGKTFPAEVVFINLLKDLAILKIRPDALLTPIEFTDSDLIKSESPVFTIGSVQRSDNSVSAGTVTRIERKDKASDGSVNSIQVAFDFEMTPGDSGRPIFDGSGKCIGIIAAGALMTRNTIYAIPANMIRDTFSKFANTSRTQSEKI